MTPIENKKLVWWRDVPIDVEIGLLTYLSKVWKNDIYIISANDYEAARKQCLWNTDSFDNVHMITGNLDEKSNKALTEKLLAEDNVNIFSGVRGGHKKYLDYLNNDKKHKCVIVMESPSLFGTNLKYTVKKIAYPILYGSYYRKYKSVVKGLFALGEKGVNIYTSYGWRNVFDFMYLPCLHKQEKSAANKPAEIRMLYIGRFDYSVKGVNVLMDAIDKLDAKNKWSIDLVGGYGAKKDEVIAWCERTPGANYIGSWESGLVVEKMTDYDFCIVPSISDGWNLTPLQTLNAGIGCIITDNAGSQELIRNSGAGIVVKSNNIVELKSALEYALENREQVMKWKEKALSYADKVSTENVGSYFVKALKYCFGESEERPECPW